MRRRIRPDLVRRVTAALGVRATAGVRVAGWAALRPAALRRARRRLARLEPGAATVVTVNWNSWPHLEVLVDLVRRRSPPGTRIIVVDNASRDGSRRRLRSDDGLTAILLPVNLGHDLALDLGVLRCETEYVVTLDVDAFPIRANWLDVLLAPLGEEAAVSGARLNRDYVHPCCWAMRTARFVERSHSFRSRYQPRAAGRDASGDVGEEISAAEAPRLHFLEVTSQRGPGDVGTVFGDLVYHNFYATRFRATEAEQLDGAVRADDAAGAWREALGRFGADAEGP